MKIIEDRIGEINYNTYGSKMTVIEYNKQKYKTPMVTIKFENGYTTSVQYGQFKRGYVLFPYDKTVLKVGFIGEGKYKPSINQTNTIEYMYWEAMLRRCYSEKYHQRQPSYKECEVCTEWHNFQNFAKWFNENYYEIEGQRMHIDKDILHKGNKIYSPETCIFVPIRINEIFTDKSSQKKDGLPTNISYLNNKYKVRIKIRDINSNKAKSKVVGNCTTLGEAELIYKQEQEKYIKEIADEYKERIPTRLYNALYQYKV